MYLGIDIGTSGVRCCVMDSNSINRSQSSVSYPGGFDQQRGHCHEQRPAVWWDTLCKALAALDSRWRRSCLHLAVDGTSGTVLGLDANNNIVGNALMYNDARASAEASRIAQIAPADSAAHGPSSGLAKILWLQSHRPEITRFLHQSDWISGKLLGGHYVSDENNALKSGYDPLSRQWPDWLHAAGINPACLPRVYEPGHALGTISYDIASGLDLNPSLQIHAGTTDSIAAFLSSPARAFGDAVTSLGSTLSIKLLSPLPVFSAPHGIYSHRLGTAWLVGGASNSGGAALLRYFKRDQLANLSEQLPMNLPAAHYYPLPAIGERFPVCDPLMESRVTPRPKSDARFLQHLLEGLAGIEALAYERLEQLGAPAPRHIYTSGGGAQNRAWLTLRQQRLPCGVSVIENNPPACGTARLARGLADMDSIHDQ